MLKATWKDRWEQFIEDPLITDTNYIFQFLIKK